MITFEVNVQDNQCAGDNVAVLLETAGYYRYYRRAIASIPAPSGGDEPWSVVGESSSGMVDMSRDGTASL